VEDLEDRVTDNVTRKGAWERDHKHLGVKIKHHDDKSGWYWEATWTEARQITDPELAGLLDKLEATFPEAEPLAPPEPGEPLP